MGYKSLLNILLKFAIYPCSKVHFSAIRVSDYGNSQIWMKCYLALVLVEKIFVLSFRKEPNLLICDAVFCNAYNESTKLMDFPHRWIRIVCARICGWHLSVNQSFKLQWTQSDNFGFLAKKSCDVLSDLNISQSLCTQTMKNLLF